MSKYALRVNRVDAKPKRAGARQKKSEKRKDKEKNMYQQEKNAYFALPAERVVLVEVCLVLLGQEVIRQTKSKR